MRLAGSGVREAGIADFRVASSVQRPIRKDVYDAEGQRIGGVEDLYIDWQEREVRFLEVGTGGFLGIGKKRFLVQVEAVMQIAENRITIEPGRTEKVDGPASFHIKVAPPRADEPCDEDQRLVPIKIVIDLLQRGRAT